MDRRRHCVLVLGTMGEGEDFGFRRIRRKPKNQKTKKVKKAKKTKNGTTCAASLGSRSRLSPTCHLPRLVACLQVRHSKFHTASLRRLISRLLERLKFLFVRCQPTVASATSPLQLPFFAFLENIFARAEPEGERTRRGDVGREVEEAARE